MQWKAQGGMNLMSLRYRPKQSQTVKPQCGGSLRKHTPQILTFAHPSVSPGLTNGSGSELVPSFLSETKALESKVRVSLFPNTQAPLGAKQERWTRNPAGHLPSTTHRRSVGMAQPVRMLQDGSQQSTDPHAVP